MYQHGGDFILLFGLSVRVARERDQRRAGLLRPLGKQLGVSPLMESPSSAWSCLLLVGQDFRIDPS